jgi:hypothetical protein
MNSSQAITAKGKLVGLGAHPIFASVQESILFNTPCIDDDLHVKSKPSRMRIFRRSIGNQHLSQRETIKYRPKFTVVVVNNSRQRNTLPVTESYWQMNIRVS